MPSKLTQEQDILYRDCVQSLRSIRKKLKKLFVTLEEEMTQHD